MMQRRNIGKSGSESHDESISSPTGPPRIGRPLGFGSARSSRLKPWMLIVLAAFITLLTYLFPDAEKEIAQEAFAAEQKLENDVAGWWGAMQPQRKPPMKDDERNDDAEERRKATERMKSQESKWVEGEKKLKAKLKILAARQAEGKDLGVPVATRWLGEDIPAWAGEGVDVEEWNGQVKKRYDEMREEEKQWKEMVAVIIENGSPNRAGSNA